MLMKAMPGALLTFMMILIVSVAGAGQSQKTRQHRIIPIAPMSQDVEILYTTTRR